MISSTEHLLASTSDQPAQKRPNIVLILTDDLGINDLHCYGREEHSTPHLDQLAKEGVRFTSAYCAQPICSASRAALLTGKSPARLHLTTYLPGRKDTPTQMLLQPAINQQLPLSEVTLAERLAELGYTSGIFGKWHLGGNGFQPEQQGFEYQFLPRGNSPPSATEGGKYEYEITRRANEFIANHRDQPFFCYIAHHTPHVVLNARPELIRKHQKAFNPIYAAMMETMDEVVGQVLKQLDDLDLRDNTIVIFTSDNGGLHVPELSEASATYNLPYRGGKGYLYEGGLRVPLIVRWPGHIPPGESHVPMVNTDWVPTLVELCGGQIDTPLDGVSQAKVLTRTAPADINRSFPFHFPHYTNQGGRPSGALRKGPWKMIDYYDDRPDELFNLETDPGERTNLAKEHPDRLAQMKQELKEWRESVKAQENSPNPEYQANEAWLIYSDFDTSIVPVLKNAKETGQSLYHWRLLMDKAVSNQPAAARPAK